MTCSQLTSAIVLIGSLVAPASAHAQGRSQIHHDRTRNAPPPAATGRTGTTGNGIDYNGGAVMLGTTNMYYIWYGTWDANSVSILTNLAQNIGGSPYFNINTTYFDGTGANVSNSVNFGGSTTDNYSRAKSLGDADIATIVSSALTSGKLPTDNHGVYFVLTSADVTETDGGGFCTNYCGWHTSGPLNGTNIKYAFIGNPEHCPAFAGGGNACAAQSPGPNGTTGADGMASVISHELEESVTDPNIDAWYNNVTGEENADMCAWIFGNTYPASNAKAANMKLGPMDYLIQQNWVNASGGFCASSYNPTSPDFSLSVSPNSQSALPGSSTGNYAVKITPANGFAAAVSLTASPLPAGATASFSVNPATSSSNLSIALAGTVTPGSYTFTITGVSGSLTHTANATLVVTGPNFSLSVSPGSQSVSQGGTTGNYLVTMNPTSGFSAGVTLSASGLPTGATPTFSANPVTGSSNLTVKVATSTPTGTRSFTITGTSNSLIHTVTATLVVTSPGASGLRFVPVTPCRVIDTRLPAGPFGGPALTAGGTRAVTIPLSNCGISSSAVAYSLNATVVPAHALAYLTLWPSGSAQPFVSTLNSFDGRIKANAAIVPAGVNGAVSVYVTDATDVILDINGYFVPAAGAVNLSFYPVTPCRVADTRNPTGLFGGPSLAAAQVRPFSIANAACGIPATAQAYSLNMTAVPSGALSFLTTWPAGQSQPVVSTLNAFTGTVTANAAIVPAGVNGAINVYVTNTTDLIIDINGYFAAPGSAGELLFYPVNPCRISDTRNAVGSLGGPVMSGGLSRDFPVTSSGCLLPAAAKAYSLNATVVPQGALAFLTLWPAGQAQPSVSTLNAFDGSIVSNAAIVPAAGSGSVSAYVTNTTDLILDANGYFAP